VKQQPQSAGASGGNDLNYWKGRTDGADRYHIAGMCACWTLGGAVVTENVLYAFPFYCPRVSTWDRLGVFVTAAGTNLNIRMSIYDTVSAYNPYPNAMLYDSGVIAVGAGAGLQTVNPAFVTSGTMLYWLCFHHEYDDPPTFQCINPPTTGYFPVFGMTSAYVSGFYLSTARAFGAPPAPFPAGATVQNAASVAIGVRYSA
jgi:hypothetical protein